MKKKKLILKLSEWITEETITELFKKEELSQENGFFFIEYNDTVPFSGGYCSTCTVVIKYAIEDSLFSNIMTLTQLLLTADFPFHAGIYPHETALKFAVDG